MTMFNASQNSRYNLVGETMAELEAAPLISGVNGEARPRPPEPNSSEVAFLIVVATIGMVGNLGILAAILVVSRLRRASNAFIFHQSVLDFLKSAYCLPFAQTLVGHTPQGFCSVLGGSYIVFVTTSAFNLLALVMNESYQFADLTLGIKDSRNYCCVIFGIFIIWFSSIIMNLGVAFIPGNPSFDREMGHCIFVYGVTRNYVLHVLWIVLITLATSLTFAYLRMLYMDIKKSSYYRMNTLIRHTISIDTNVRTASQRRRSEVREKHHIKHVQSITRKKLALLIILVVLFVLFWYPLFSLSTVDAHFQVPPAYYKALTMFAWSNSALTPFMLFFLIKSGCCCHDEDETMLLEPREQFSPEGSPGPGTSNPQPDGRLVGDNLVEQESTTLHEYYGPDTSHQFTPIADRHACTSTDLPRLKLADNGRSKPRKEKSVSLWI